MDSQPFAGKKALVTGAAKRLGGETARRLARLGVQVAVHFNTSRRAAETLCRELGGLGVKAVAVQGNLDDPEEVGSALEGAWEALEGLDYLVNNASIFPTGRLDELDLDTLQGTLRVNTWAPFLLTRAFWRHLRGAGRVGAVVNLLDTRLVGGDLAHAAYHLSKAMLRELTLLTALEFAPELRVNAVAPGAVLAPEGLGDDHLRRLVGDLPLKRRGYPRDVAEAVVYLLGAEFVTGQILFVDGGRHIRLGGST